MYTAFIQKEGDDDDSQTLTATILYHKVGRDWAITKSWKDENSPNYIQQYFILKFSEVDFSIPPRWLVRPHLEFFRFTIGNVTYGPQDFSNLPC